jgi:hypothetical protein
MAGVLVHVDPLSAVLLQCVVVWNKGLDGGDMQPRGISEVAGHFDKLAIPRVLSGTGTLVCATLIVVVYLALGVLCPYPFGHACWPSVPRPSSLWGGPAVLRAPSATSDMDETGKKPTRLPI